MNYIDTKKWFPVVISLIACAFMLTVCASSNVKKSSFSADSVILNVAIAEAASYFIGRLPQGAKLALVSFDTPTGRLSDYIFEEIWTRFEDSNNFVMVDRKNLERIETEINHQYMSGKVDDELMVSMTKQYGAEILVYGQMISLGQGISASEYRLTVYATDVEKASSSQRAFTIRSDNRFASLLNVSLDDEVERAVQVMAKSVDQKTVIAVGRISYADTQTVTNLSAWLRNSIIAGAQKQRNKFQVATGNESADFAVASRGFAVAIPAADSPIQAVVTGNYSPLDDGAEVSLWLTSAIGNKTVLASQHFVIRASELERRKLSLLPEKDGTIITKPEFERKQQAIDPYAGKNNKWTFTVSPDVLDGIYYEGDYMTMRIYSDRDCYFRITHVDVNGNTQVIYPLATADNNRLRAGETRRIPDNTRYLLGSPFGEEMILVAAYDQPFTLNPQSGTSPLSADSITRGLNVVNNQNAMISPSVTAKFSYTVLRK